MTHQKKSKSERIAPRVDPTLKSRILRVCETTGVSSSDFARAALIMYLEKVSSLQVQTSQQIEKPLNVT